MPFDTVVLFIASFKPNIGILSLSCTLHIALIMTPLSLKIPISLSRFPSLSRDSHISLEILISLSRFPSLTEDSHITLMLPISLKIPIYISQDSHISLKIPISLLRFPSLSRFPYLSLFQAPTSVQYCWPFMVLANSSFQL